MIGTALRRGGLAGALAMVFAGAAVAGDLDSVNVAVDHAKVIRLPERTQTVIIGNPFIADVTTQRNGVMVVTGKSYGVTNMIALDGSGTMIAESLISVRAPTESLVTVQRGLERESYSCTPICMPTLSLGDSSKHFDSVAAQAGARNGFAAPKGP